MPKYNLIIRNALAARPDGCIYETDIACRNGKIDRIAPSIDGNAIDEIDASGRLTLPGVIDAQVHFRDPGATHKEDIASGSRAAVSGGVTSFLEMPNTNPTTTDQNALNAKLDRAAQVSVANFGFFIGATPNNLSDINTCAPVCGIKVFMGSSTGTLLVHEQHDLEKIFGNGDRLIAVHAEDERRIRERSARFANDPAIRGNPKKHTMIRDDQCALLATQTACELSHRFDRRLHVLHLTSAIEVEYLRTNKTDKITVECPPQHLFLTEHDYERLGTRMQMNPPIRTQADQDALWAGLHDGTIDFIATDHAPHTLEEKSKPYPESPSGMPGVETSLPLMLSAFKSGKCTLPQVLKWMCEGPAKAYGIRNKGRLVEGYDADIAIVDMENEYAIRDENMLTKVGWTSFHDKLVVGRPLWTIVGGEIAYCDGRIKENVRGTRVKFES